MLSDAARVLLDHTPDTFNRLWAARLGWRLSMHHYQCQPVGEWRGWMLQGGRGTGKTLTGAWDANEFCLDNPGARYGVIAPTFGDARDICVEGETGIKIVADRMGLDYDWNRSLGEFIFANGSRIDLYSAEKPDRLRGPQHHRLWFEELASFKDAHKGDALQTTFNNALLGLRLKGFGPTRYLVTTTPRRVALIQDLIDRANVRVTRGTTYDNLDNLDAEYREEIMRYEGTHLGRQELLGELIAAVEGAFWTLPMIDQAHKWQPDTLPDFRRTVTGVDPSGGADVIGIVTAGVIQGCPCGFAPDKQPHYGVTHDHSLKASPEVWATQALRAEADVIAAEANYGGDMVVSTIRTADKAAPVKKVNASRGKLVRAEPISLLYEQGRVHHFGSFPAMEDEMTTYVAGEPWSPNRLDALVWAMTELTTNPKRDWAAY